MVEATLIGEDEMLNVLKNFSHNVQKRLMRQAVRSGAKVIMEDIKRRVPVDTGSLRDSLDVVKRKSKDKNEIYYSVLPRASKKKTKKFKLKDGTRWKIKGEVAAGWYAHFVEFGTSHSAPHPFMRPAISKADEALEQVKKTLQKGVSNEFERSKR
ncbi:HK97-gp10 family putative phage morphogenesis protein [Sulfurimonas sp. HSL-1716]|uniref:HK97-gp10 family putative phage morphogenesis protein n=1 Tax=Hydrocurvibacter sulfurireducens TaxID=3131937 RepID=UPI0031F7DDA4